MPLDEAKREELKKSTLEAAVALVDDLAYLRRLSKKQEPSPGEIRRASAILRRILVEGALSQVAAPRLGRIELAAPNLNAIHRSNRSKPISFFAAAGVELFGISVASAMCERAIQYDTFRITTLICEFLCRLRVF